MHLFHSQGQKCSQIRRIINETRPADRQCTPSGVLKVVQRINKPSRGIAYGTQRKLLGRVELDFMNAAIYCDRELSAVELQRMFYDKFSSTVSVSVISSERQKEGWVLTNTRYCQMVRADNKIKRLQFCLDIQLSGDTFQDVIFTDECTVRCERSLSKQYRRRDELSSSVMKPKPKHTYSFTPWSTP